jgi:hypothetical protein
MLGIIRMMENKNNNRDGPQPRSQGIQVVPKEGRGEKKALVRAGHFWIVIGWSHLEYDWLSYIMQLFI